MITPLAATVSGGRKFQSCPALAALRKSVVRFRAAKNSQVRRSFLRSTVSCSEVG